MSVLIRPVVGVCGIALLVATGLTPTGGRPRAIPLVIASLDETDQEHSTAKPQKRVNVLLISLDTTRKDHLSCYGYERRTTPHIDALAEDSLLFTRCVAASNWTLPTHASMLTGLYPPTHGAFGYPNAKPMLPSCWTLAEALQQTGYRTGAIVANYGALSKGLQFDQGFELYDDRAGKRPALWRRASEITDEAITWLAQDDDRPFFLFLNFLDPHAPYLPPPPYDARFRNRGKQDEALFSWPQARMFWEHHISPQIMGDRQLLLPEVQDLMEDLYDGEIAYMDEQVGRLLRWLRQHRLYESTLIVVTADHGEALGEHNVRGHNWTLYEPEVAVPLIVKFPHSRRTGVVDYGAQHVDIMPTVLEVLGLPISSQIQGASLLAPVSRDLVAIASANTVGQKLWSQSSFTQIKWSLYRGNLKYIEYSDGCYELYDLDRDPQELDDLSQILEEEVSVLRKALHAWRERTKPLEDNTKDNMLSAPDDVVEKLRELGYIQ